MLRMLMQNQSILMDKDKSELNPTEKSERRAAKKTGKPMIAKNGDYKDIVSGWMATDGVCLSQASSYKKGDTRNKHGKKFCSQQAYNKFRQGDETDSDDSD